MVKITHCPKNNLNLRIKTEPVADGGGCNGTTMSESCAKYTHTIRAEKPDIQISVYPVLLFCMNPEQILENNLIRNLGLDGRVFASV